MVEQTIDNLFDETGLEGIDILKMRFSRRIAPLINLVSYVRVAPEKISDARHVFREQKYLRQIKQLDHEIVLTYTTELLKAGRTNHYTGLDDMDLVIPNSIISPRDKAMYRKAQLDIAQKKLEEVKNMINFYK